VNCGIIAFCDKISFLTGIVLLFQRRMRTEVEELKRMMIEELEFQREGCMMKILMMKVSTQTGSPSWH
jgi:hypothetical protein